MAFATPPPPPPPQTSHDPAVGRVTRVGVNTEVGRIARDVGMVEDRKSPLQVKLDELGEMIVKHSCRLIGFMFVLELLIGDGVSYDRDNDGVTETDAITLKERIVKGMSVR